MTHIHLALLTLIIACAIPSARSQQPKWDMSGAKEVETSITSLSARDQQGIEHVVRERPEHLRAMRTDTVSGPIFIVQGVGDICGAANCEMWVLSSNYRVLLESTIQQFKIQPTTHHGYPDIRTSMHGSAFSGDLKQWQFNGTKYHHIACASYNYADADGNEFKNPHITPEPCYPQ